MPWKSILESLNISLFVFLKSWKHTDWRCVGCGGNTVEVERRQREAEGGWEKLIRDTNRVGGAEKRNEKLISVVKKR